MLSECFWIHWQHLSLLGREKQLIELSPILGAGFFAQLKASYAEKISSTMLYTHPRRHSSDNQAIQHARSRNSPMY